LIVLSCAEALPASATDIEAAQSRPRIGLNFMLIVSESYHPMPGSEGLGDARGVGPAISCMPALHARLASASCGHLCAGHQSSRRSALQTSWQLPSD
jgi:hypothetical protein